MFALSYLAVNSTWVPYGYMSGEEIVLAAHDVEQATALPLARPIAEKYENTIMRQRSELKTFEVYRIKGGILVTFRGSSDKTAVHVLATTLT
jgi:hypothetical protein